LTPPGREALADRFPLSGPLPSDERALTDLLLEPVQRPAGGARMALLALAAFGTLALFGALGWTFAIGVGTWGNNIPVGWAFGITNFVWWIGIGHAGTFISAILLLFEQSWRTSINRMAEAMTLFAVANAALFPVAHLGRPWFAYWLLPYPATMGVWPNFRSPLVFDVFAISTYGLVSLLFWYLGLVPDFAAARERCRSPRQRFWYGVFALGWRGASRDWERYRKAYFLLGGLAAPLVVSVHSVVSLDFAVTQVPGWHGTLFPPYFVAGAIFSGFAMVLTLLLPARKALGLENVITKRHLDSMSKILLVTGLIVAYSYGVEYFGAWYKGERYEAWTYFNLRPTGRYRVDFWLMVTCNVLVPQLLWSERVCTTPLLLWPVAVLVNVGMWMERFVIIAVSLTQDYVPSAWADYSPTWVDYSLLFGSMGFFVFLFLLFIRWVPSIPIVEMRELRAEHRHGAHRGART